MSQSVSREVDITAFYYNHTAGRLFPRRIEMNGQCVALLESGMRCRVGTGQANVELYNMTDGYAQYDLRFERDQRQWTLISSHGL
jgi:hypothetical protein